VLNTFFAARYRAVDELLLLILRTPGLRNAARTRFVIRQVLRLGCERRATVTDALLDRITAHWTGDRADIPIRSFVDAFGVRGRPELRRLEREVHTLTAHLRIGLADADLFCTAYTRALAAHLPAVPVHVFPGAAHFFPLERPKAVADYIRS
jgi:pimeloyl-ACP methyl ester carboxylesterase